METTDDVINDFMGGTPRANQWRELRLVLEERLVDATLQLQATEVGRAAHRSLQRKVNEMNLQVTELVKDEAVAQFVENSVIATVSKQNHPQGRDGFDT